MTVPIEYCKSSWWKVQSVECQWGSWNICPYYISYEIQLSSFNKKEYFRIPSYLGIACIIDVQICFKISSSAYGFRNKYCRKQDIVSLALDLHEQTLIVRIFLGNPGVLFAESATIFMSGTIPRNWSLKQDGARFFPLPKYFKLLNFHMVKFWVFVSCFQGDRYFRIFKVSFYKLFWRIAMNFTKLKMEMGGLNNFRNPFCLVWCRRYICVDVS